MDKEKEKNVKRPFEHMSNRHKSFILLIFLDVLFAVGAYAAARAIMYAKTPAPPSFLHYEVLIASVFMIVTAAMFIFFDCYNTVWRYAGRIEFFKLIIAYFATFGILMLFKVVLKVAFASDLWSTLIILYLILSAMFSGGLRFFNAIVSYLKHVRGWVDEKQMRSTKRTIIIGAGYTGSLAVNRFINNPHEGYFPVALVDDDPEKIDRKIYGIRVEGGVENLDEIVYKFRAQAIVIAIMSITRSQLKSIYGRCIKYNIPIKIMPAITNADELTSNTLTLRDIKIEELLGREEFRVRQDLIDSSVKDKVVCVTGGAGSIGSELCRQVLKFGCRHLVIFDVHENGMFELDLELGASYDRSLYSLCMGTVRERERVRDVFTKYKPDIVFHAAAYKHVPMMEISACEAIKNNVFGTLNVINQSVESGVEKFVLISTDKAVNPANIMGASKRIAEMLIQSIGAKSRMKMAAVRFGNVLGSNGSVIPVFLKQIKDGGPVTLTDRNIKRYFMTIPEAVRLVLQTGALANSGEVFVLDMGEPVYIYNLACDLIRINGLVPEKDIPIEITGLRPGEKLFEELRYDKECVDTTVHEGIFVTRLQDIGLDEFEKRLDKLYLYSHAEDEEKTIDEIFALVPSSYRNKPTDEQINSPEFISQGARAETGRGA
ncbi:MAG: polysaccharide biosynthesis protein [Clostridiales bacterium]|jgi:FlaA1/EpsC-like NDP-sugar epimerase|nr:polysaccharide biosynthesis protein [Clostridiales bacterium]